MAKASANADLVERFDSFYRNYYEEEISELAQRYPSDQRSLYVDYDDLYRFDVDLAEDYRTQPEQMQEYAEEALRQFDLPADVKLGRAHVRLRNLGDAVDIRDIRVHDDHIGRMIEVRGIVRKATDVRPKVVEAAFECQRCGTMTYIPQSDGSFQEPHECQGCERQGPFRVNHDQSEFVDSQQIRVQESPEGLRGGETPQHIDVNLEDDVTGEVTAGDHVAVVGVLHIEQMEQGQEKSAVFDLYMDGVSVQIEDEQFEDMEISDADIEEILSLSGESDIYEQMVDSIAPTIYGYEEEKLAMVLQLFSGVTKQLPDKSRIRGDMHILLIGDPGTGKSQLLSYLRKVAPRSVYTSGKGSSSAGLCVTGDTLVHTADGFRQIEDIVAEDLDAPVEAETAAERSLSLYTLDRESDTIERRDSSHVWRMPEKPCRRIETGHGKTIEASRTTPVLTCGADGIEWTPVSEVDAGDYVAVPRYDDVDRTEVPVREYLELTNETVRLDEESVAFVRRRLREAYGTLGDAAAALDLGEAFVSDTLSTRHVPVEKLDAVLDGLGVTRADVGFERVTLRHGASITLPETFDEDLSYLLGLVFGDGDISLDRRDGTRGTVRLSNGDESVLRRATDVFEAQFDKRVEIERREDRAPRIRVDSATIARLFANAGMQPPKADRRLDPALTTSAHADAFLRGLMDADGSVSTRERGGSSILLSTISEGFARQVQLMLETYGVRARTRERDRRGTHDPDDGRSIESKRVEHLVEISGADVDRYAERIGFDVEAKRTALRTVASDGGRRGDTLPVGAALAQSDGPSDAYSQNVRRGDNPGRSRVRTMLDEVDLGPVEAELRWDEVVAATDTGEKEVFDLTVPGTHNFVGNGVVTHNTAAAVRDDFGEGQQWTLEAGALVLADQGIAAVDELDKMRCVTGETLVHGADGIERIRDIAVDEARDGVVESHPNGRTIRGVDDRAVWTMTEDGRLVTRPVEAIHEYEAPTELSRVTLATGERLTATDDHPFFVREDGERVERATADLAPGDRVYVPRDVGSLATDGGVVTADTDRSAGPDVTCRRVASVESVPASGVDDRSRVYDLTVAGTHNFVANGMVVHNSEDRSAMHQALEQQEISVSKAGINATLKSRCSLLGAANPRYGRFDPYEPIAEQIDLEPALISRFDLIFIVQDEQDEEKDSRLADHILQSNYAGELNTQRTRMTMSEVSDDEIERATETVEPAIEPELFRKYIAYARRSCFPRLTDAARERIKEFYVDFRMKGSGEDNPIPITARKLEAVIRLAEASARVRLSDTVDEADAERALELVRSCLEDIMIDPETGEYDADIVETGTSKTQRDRKKNLRALIQEVEKEYEEGAPIDEVLSRADEAGIDRAKAEEEIENLKQKGEVYEPSLDHLRTT
ncbi:MAG: LAGLIDADG family homing endonuclease [Haloferacaceae archaeon]